MPDDDDPIRSEALRLSRPHPSGGRVIERAAILAAGADARAIMTWVTAHGEAEELLPLAGGQGLHGARTAAADTRRPLRYVFSS